MILLVVMALAGAPEQLPVALDTILPVGPAARLRVDARAGRIDVRTWNRSAVRVVARHAPGAGVRVQGSPEVVSVWAAGSGPPARVEYSVTVPPGIALALVGGNADITVSGARSDVEIRNYGGAVAVEGGRGTVSVRSTLGAVSVTGARGRISARSQNGVVRLRDVAGDVEAESADGHLYLEGVDASRVRAVTTGGTIRFAGPLHTRGSYSFTAHDGSITLSLLAPPNAVATVGTVSGGFSSAFPYRVRERSGGYFTAVFGTGAATLELATFGGGIVIARAPPR